MTRNNPNSKSHPVWIGRLVQAIAVMAIGWIANQFWLIPIQQQHQDDAIKALIERIDRDESIMNKFAEQHTAMIREIDRSNRTLQELSATMEDHERRERIRSKRRD
jgi:GMP synthase PP-ATPase subunit